MHDPYKFEEPCNLMSKGVDLIAIFRIFQWVSNFFFYILLTFSHVDQCKVWTPMCEVKLPQVSVSMR